MKLCSHKVPYEHRCSQCLNEGLEKNSANPLITISDAEIREIFLANGFSIKEGQTDLKPYIYAAARALLDKVNKNG